MSVIETRGLTKVYGETRAVDGLDIRVERGQVFGFLGPNGSGKTTTIGMLLGIITPTGGSFRLLGADSRSEREAAKLRVGATLEQPNFYPYLSCRDNLILASRVKRAPEGAVDEALDVVGLTSRQKTKFGACSLGMKQRLALAATMLGDPDLLILDEPANGLDPEGMREIREIIGRLAARGATIFLSSHLLVEVERTCTHVAILRRGKVVATGSVAEITEGARIAVFGAGDANALAEHLRAHPDCTDATVDGDRVRAQIGGQDLAAVNRWLAERGVYVSHLSLERRSLEDAFLESTGGGRGSAPGMREVP